MLVGLLFPLCDVLASCDVKQEERAYFVSPVFSRFSRFPRGNFLMMNDYLRKLDTDEAVIMDVFGLSKKFVHVKTPLFDLFLNGLQEDQFGNIQ